MTKHQNSALHLTVFIFLLLFMSASGFSQSLGWEGETGIFVTPLAYTATGEGHKIHPVVAYHYMNGGPVVGDFHEFSTTIGIGNRFELGYTHQYHITGGDPNFSPLWQSGFEIFNGKVNVLVLQL